MKTKNSIPTVCLVLILIFTLGNLSYAENPDPDCMHWLKNGKITAGSKSCELECSMLVTDMGTFMCPNQCDILCKTDESTSIVGKLLYYPGLTPDEKKLVEKNPKDAATAFVQKTRAEMSSNRNFPEQGLNDESDAFRHFIWAGLLTKELGQEKAEQFLDAHEENRLQNSSEKIMDLFNNQKGQEAAQQLISEKKWSLINLEAKGLDALGAKKLQVLKPGLKIPEKPR